MVMKRLSLALSAILAFACVCIADEITIDGEKFKNVEIRESNTRYYIEIPSQGRTISIGKEEIDPADVVIVDEDTYVPPDEVRSSVPVGEGERLMGGASSLFISSLTANEDRLEVNALVLRAGENMIALCSMDTGAIDRRFFDNVVRQLRLKRSAIDQDNLMLAATHTYASALHVIQGPLEEVLFGDFSQEEFEYGATRVSDAIVTAEQNLKPVRIRFAQGKVDGFTYNHAIRDVPLANQMLVAVIETDDGAPLAYVVNFAAQPNFLQNKGLGPGRDFPGGLAAAIRSDYGAGNLPVLFLNGACGNVRPEAPGGGDPVQRAFITGKALGQEALRLIKENASEPDNMVTIRSRTRVDVQMPPHMLEKFIPKTTILQDFWIGDTVLLSLPGEPSSGIGEELRAKAQEKGGKYVFLVGCAADYTGFHTTVREYFESREEATLSFYGPLVVCWYLDNHLPAPVLKASEPWKYSKMVAAHREAFEQAREKAKVNAESIRVHWEEMDQKLTKLHEPLKNLGDLAPEAEKILKKVPSKEAIEIGKQYGAYFVRHEKAHLNDEERVVLMGIADGAKLPFDSIMLLQFMATPEGGLPDEAKAIMDYLKVKGVDFLSEYP